MSRLASQAKMGHYPTPPEVVEQIRELLSFSSGSRCLDTCCGNGDALSLLTNQAPVETYGIELDKDRAREAKRKLKKVLNCDALYETRITNNAFDLLFLNPPYDWETKENETDSLRTEMIFLQYHLRYLNSKGVLVYIIPFKSLKHTYRHFLRFKDLRILAFPEELYKQFKQVVVIGKATAFAGKERLDANRKMLTNIIKLVDQETAYESLWTTESILRSGEYRPLYEVETNDVELKTFTSTRIDPEDALPLIENSQVYVEFERQLKVKKVEDIRPLSILRNGHLAMLLASGMINGVLENDKYKFIVKGNIKSFMQQDELEEEDENIQRQLFTKKYQVQVRALDLNALRFIDIN
jgi:16S rRNA G966 N2-methylase RsmD